MKFSLDSFEDLLLEWKVEQVEDDSLVLAKELAPLEVSCAMSLTKQF
jgi:hypothetical protein